MNLRLRLTEVEQQNWILICTIDCSRPQLNLLLLLMGNGHDWFNDDDDDDDAGRWFVGFKLQREKSIECILTGHYILIIYFIARVTIFGI